MKGFKKTIIIISIFILIFTLTGCAKDYINKEGKSIDPEIIGTWTYKNDHEQTIYELKKKGKGSYTNTIDGVSITKTIDYYTENGKIYLVFENDSDTFELRYSVKDNKMTILDLFNEEYVYTKGD